MENPLDMTKQTLERLEAEASTMADHHRPPSENERREVVDASRGGERRVPERRWSAEYEMMPPPPSPALRPKSATPRRDFSQPRSRKNELAWLILLYPRSPCPPSVNSPFWAPGASPGLEGPGAVPEHLFSPTKQERFGARGSPK